MSIVNDAAAKIYNRMEVIKGCVTMKKSNLVSLAWSTQVYMVHDPILIVIMEFVKSAICSRRVNYPGKTRFTGLFSIFFRNRLRNSLLGGCSAMLHPRFRTRNEKKILTSVSQKNTWANPILERSCTKIEMTWGRNCGITLCGFLQGAFEQVGNFEIRCPFFQIAKIEFTGSCF